MSGYPDGMTLRPIANWPNNYTLDRRSSPFSSSLTTTLDTLERELRHLGTGRRNAESVLQIAMREQDFRIDGLPRANATPQHPGVILNVESRHGTLSYPCDTFTRWQDNLRAITLGLEALRRVERYGITQTGQQYRGWQALESKPAVDAVTAACVVLARIAWPNENDERQANWAHKIGRPAPKHTPTGMEATKPSGTTSKARSRSSPAPATSTGPINELNENRFPVLRWGGA